MRRLRDERGAAAVEFALVLTPLLLLILGGIEFGRLYMVQNSITNAARAAARYAAIELAAPSGTYSNPTGDAQARTVALLSGVVTGPAVTSSMITFTYAAGSTSGCQSNTAVTATIDYTGYREVTNFLPQIPSGGSADATHWFPNELIGKATMPCGG